jgi:hypothetical protein
MSGRSAYVRKEKTKTKEDMVTPATRHVQHIPPPPTLYNQQYDPLIQDFPMPVFQNGRPPLDPDLPNRLTESLTIKSIGSSSSDDMAYARVRKPVLPSLDVSGIEKSSFRANMDKKSENIRNNLTKAFGRKKKVDPEARPTTAATIRPPDVLYAVPASTPGRLVPLINTGRPPAVPQQYQSAGEIPRTGPPQRSLPPLPAAQLKRWVGGGRMPQPWNKLRKDPELWDPNGDTLVFFSHETHQASRPPPSFRLSSHVLESTKSRFLISLLQEGSTEDHDNYEIPPSPSPVSSPGLDPVGARSRNHRAGGVSPALSDRRSNMNGQISYEIYFPAPHNLTKAETLRHQVTTRNVFALLYQASLVGLNLYQTLNDLHQRLEMYMPPDADTAGMIIDYLQLRRLDDVRNDPATAASLLAFCEVGTVRWEEGWRETFVHCAGMFHHLDDLPEFKDVSPITKALIERGNLEVSVRVQAVEERLADFDLNDMWPMMTSTPPPARTSFERLRRFLSEHYQAQNGSWPPPAEDGEEQWLTRTLAQKLQKDFGALYDYLVNRDVVWDCSEERSSRKWNIVSSGANKSFEADTADLPLTDILVAFDNRHKFPHIPHPYPLVPESMPVSGSSGGMFSRKAKQSDDKLGERRAALAYTEATNIYVLGSDFTTNDLVDAFIRFEKSDKPSEVDPYAARRGRWVLLYGVLQVLASISVDTPTVKYCQDVAYYLNPRMRGTPPWKGASQNIEEATHEGSHCWITIRSWEEEPSPLGNNFIRDRAARSNHLSMQSSVADSDNGTVSSMALSSTAPSMTNSSIKSPRSTGGFRTKTRMTRDSDNTFYSAYSPSIEKVPEWPIREQSRPPGTHQQPDVYINDYDDLEY